RFGMWDDIIAQPDLSFDERPFTSTFRHAAKAVAHAAKGDTATARKHQQQYLANSVRVSEDTTLGNNPAADVFKIVTPMVDEAIAALRQAVEAEDQLRYDEPPAWLIPVRHALGAVLMENQRFAEAEAVYREDLRQLPNNGWSLYGLSRSLESQGKADEAAQF